MTDSFWIKSLLHRAPFGTLATAYDGSGNNASSSVTVQANNFIDVTPPTVAISSPASGATVSGTVTVTVSASDNVGVSRVEIYLDGLLQVSDSTTPYEWSWNSLQTANGSFSEIPVLKTAAG